MAVSDLNRLGKRGAYRLGRLGAPAPAPRRAACPALPVVGPGAPRIRRLLWLLGCLAAVALIALGAVAGWWFLPFVAGLAGGAAARYGRWRLRVALPAAALVAAVGWGIPLGWQAASRGPGPGDGAGGRGAGRAAAARLGRDRGHPAGRGAPGPGWPLAGLGPGPQVVARPGRSAAGQSAPICSQTLRTRR